VAHAREEVRIDAPVGEVWALHSRPETILRVSVNTTRYEPQGPMRVGTRILGATKVIGRTVEWSAEVVELTELRGYRLKSVISPVSWELAYSYRPEGAGTVVTAEQTAFGLQGFFGRISESFIVRRYTKDLRRNLGNLKALVESQGARV
jgi:ligand-binding SRPBCC domain-containing protein